MKFCVIQTYTRGWGSEKKGLGSRLNRPQQLGHPVSKLPQEVRELAFTAKFTHVQIL